MTKIITSAVLATALISTSALAGELQMTSDVAAAATAVNDTTSATFDPALAKNAAYSVVTAAVAVKTIAYIPGVILGANSDVNFVVAGGAFAAGTWNLCDQTGALAGSVNDFDLDANNDFTRLSFKIAADSAATDTFYLSDAVCVAAPGAAWTANIAQGQTSNVSVSVPNVYSAASLPLTAPLATAISVLSAGATMGAVYTDAVNNVIDVTVGSDRKKIIIAAVRLA